MSCGHCKSDHGELLFLLFEFSWNFLASVLAMSWARVTALPSSVSRN